MYFRFHKGNFQFTKGEERRKLSFPSTVNNFRATFRSPRYWFIASYDAKNELKSDNLKTRTLTKTVLQRTSEDYSSVVFIGRLSIKTESTVLKSSRWKVLGRIGLLSADIGLLIDGTNFFLALVLLQCSKRTSWLSGDSGQCISQTRLTASP